jgi:class 3 adenylate cyclase/tetratricopeptide (TPR) repeat protein
MTFDEILAQIIELLQREGRISYRALKRRFSLDDEYLDDLKTEIIRAKRLAIDEDGAVLVWTGRNPPQAVAAAEPRANAETESAAAARVALSDEGERRQLTVMFCDLVGSTPLSEQFDPEELRDLIRAYQHTCSAVIARFNGRIAKYLGDGLLAYFGYPHAHEDDAQRAVRAALGIVGAMHTLNAEHGRHPLPNPPPYQTMGEVTVKAVSLNVRLGIHTGLVVVGEMGGGEFRERDAIVGDTPNTASRLQELAEPDSVVISGATYQLVRGLFDCEALGACALKGLSTPVQVYRVLRETEAQSRFDVAMRTGLTPLIGREHESGILAERWERARSGEGQLLLLSGEPGIGKSRLVQAFKERTAAEPITWLECHCSPYSQNSAHHPIIDLLQRLLEFEGSDDSAVKLSKLECGLKKYDLPVADYLPLLASLFSLSVPEEYPRLTLTLEAQKEKTHVAIQSWLLRIAEREGLVLLTEDLHWADPSTLELLGPLLDQVPAARLLLILTYRPEFAPPWPNRSHFVTIAVSRLPRVQAEVVVRNVSAGKPLPPEVLDQIIRKTDGVPLFIEELTKTVLESGLLRERDGRYELTGPLPPLAIPSTLHDSLTARLDRLGTVREVAQLAATIGRDFSYELLREIYPLSDTDLSNAMTALIDAEVLYQRGLMPQAHYFFKHALIRDAAYESLLKSRRQQIHARIARVLEERFPETVETQPELVAHHYTEGGLPMQAIPYWQRAGEQAVQRSAFLESVTDFSRALDLLSESSAASDKGGQAVENGNLLCALLLGLTEGQRRSGQQLKAQQTAIRASEIARQLSSADFMSRAAMELAKLGFEVGLPVAPAATQLFEQTLEIIGPEASALRASIVIGLSFVLVRAGSIDRALESAREGVAMARQLGRDELVAMGLIGMCMALQSPEHAQQRLVYAREMLGPAKAANSTYGVHTSLWWRTYSAFELGDIAMAKQGVEGYAQLEETTRNPLHQCLLKNFLACEACLEGRFGDFEGLVSEALAIGQTLEVGNAAGIFGVQMFTLRREQDRLREVEPLLRHFVQTPEAATAWRPGLGLIYAELGRPAEAQTQFERLAQDDFAAVPRDANRLVSFTYLADVCTFLQDTSRAQILYEMMLPYNAINVLIGSGSACAGSASRYLGTLATTMRRWNDAERHFEDALAMNERMGARPWLAHTEYQYARMLLARDRAGDSDRAESLLKEALATGRALGMKALERRITSGPP